MYLCRGFSIIMRWKGLLIGLLWVLCAQGEILPDSVWTFANREAHHHTEENVTWVSADRPGEGTGSEVLTRGVIQWETGFECLHTMGTHLLTMPTTLFRFGLHKRVELRLEYTGALMVVPIAIGFMVNVFREPAAAKIHNVLKRIAMPALVLLVTVFFFQHKQTIVTEFASLGLTMTALILATTACGAILSWLLRLTTKERRTLVIEIGMQNAAQAITIACSPLIFNNEIIAIPAIIYALMMNLILLAYVGMTKIQKNL